MKKMLVLMVLLLTTWLFAKAELPDTAWVKNYYSQGGVIGIKFSKDEKNVICLLGNGNLHILDDQTGEIKRRYDSVGGYCMSMTNDGNLIAIGCRDRIKIIDWQTGKIIREIWGAATNIYFTGENNKYLATFYNLDTTVLIDKGKMIYETRHRGVIQIWDFETGAQLKNISYPFYTNINTGDLKEITISSIKSSNDGKYLGIGKEEKYILNNSKDSILFYNTNTWECVTFAKSYGGIYFSNNDSDLIITHPPFIDIYTFPKLNFIKQLKIDMSLMGFTNTLDENYNIFLFYQDDSNNHVYVYNRNLDSIVYKYNLRYLFYNNTGFADGLNTAATTNNRLAIGGYGIDMLNLKTGISDIGSGIFEKDICILYPNPSVGKVYLQYSLQISGFTELQLFDLQGNQLLIDKIGYEEIGLHFYNLNIQKYQPGTYFVRVYNGKLVKSFKFIKN